MEAAAFALPCTLGYDGKRERYRCIVIHAVVIGFILHIKDKAK